MSNGVVNIHGRVIIRFPLKEAFMKYGTEDINFTAREFSPKDGLTYYITEDGQVLKLCKEKRNTKSGYAFHSFGRDFTEYLHRMVCRLWHGKPAEKQEVRHLDGNPLNNHHSNLAWGSRSDNMIDMAMHKSGRAQKITAKQAQEIKSYAKHYGYRKILSEKFGISENHITDIRRGDKAWAHLESN